MLARPSVSPAQRTVQHARSSVSESSHELLLTLSPVSINTSQVID